MWYWIFDTYSRWEVARWLGATPRALASRDEAERAVDRWAARTDERWGLGLWAVEVRETGQVAGSVLLVTLPPDTQPPDALPRDTPPPGTQSAITRTGDEGRTNHPGVEVGWHFHPDCLAPGLRDGGGAGCVGQGFAAGLTEIYAVLRPDNAPSAAVCRRLGMTPLGRSSRWYDTELEVFRIRPASESHPPDEWLGTAGAETP